jgi:hypothetical protein
MVEAHFGLRGSGLVRFMIISVVCPAYTLLGYNNAVFGGLLDLDSFVATFPQIDTVNATGAQKANNARIQGVYICPSMECEQSLPYQKEPSWHYTP